MKINCKTKDWLKWTIVTSIPLRRLAPDGRLLEIASGCMVNCDGRKFILSVSHAVKKNSEGWAIELGWDPELGTEMYWPRAFSYMGLMIKGSAVLEEIDFCFAEVANDLNAIYAHKTPTSVLDERSRHVFDIKDFSEPSVSGIYAFAGEVKPEVHGVTAVFTEVNVYPGLRFDKSDGAYSVFKLPVEHPGHESFRGCSGAPIVDIDRKVVALVCNGNEESGEIRGISISHALTALKWYCNLGK